MCNPSFSHSLNICSFSIYRVWNTWDLPLYLRKARSLTSVPCHQHPPFMSVAMSSLPPPFVVSLGATSQLRLQSPLHCYSPGGDLISLLHTVWGRSPGSADRPELRTSPVTYWLCETTSSAWTQQRLPTAWQTSHRTGGTSNLETFPTLQVRSSSKRLISVLAG